MSKKANSASAKKSKKDGKACGCKKKKILIISIIAGVLAVAIATGTILYLTFREGGYRDQGIDTDGDGIPDYLDKEIEDSLENDNTVDVGDLLPKE